MAAAATAAPEVRIAADLSMPASAACTQTLGAIAAKGAGKSYLAGVFVEQLHDAGAPFVVFDPIGNWSSVTLAADGKGPGLGVVVVGGERADVPLVEDSAGQLGSYLVMHGVSAIVDVSELSKSKRKDYVAHFAEAMFRTARIAKSPFMVVLEEAQLFAPQHAARGEERMLGAITDIVRLGRNHGLGSMLVTQRPQSVSKEVLNQIECLFVGQLRGPHERKAITGWVDETGAADGVSNAALAELPKLSPGEFFCWSPSWLRVFKRIRIAKKRTFDGSSTPVLGQRGKPLPVKTARAELATIIDALGALGTKDEPPAKRDAGADDLLRRLVAAEAERDTALARVAVLENKIERALALAEQASALIREDKSGEPHPTPTRAPLPKLVAHSLATSKAANEKRRLPDEKPLRSTAVAGELDGPMRKILTVLVVHGLIPKRRLAYLANYAGKGGGFNNPLSRLRSGGFVEGSDLIGPTAAGIRAIGTVERPPRHGRSLLNWWLTHPRMDGAMRKILDELAECSKPVSPTELAELAGYAPGTGGFNNPLGRLRTLGLVAGGRGEKLSLAPELRG